MHTEPAVRHAVVAVSSFYEQYEDNLSNTETQTESIQSFALKQYNKAILHLRTSASSDPRHNMDVALVTCFLFVCVELLRNNRAQAISHLQYGLKLLNTRHQVDSNDIQSKSTSVLEPVEDEIRQMFARLTCQSSLFEELQASFQSIVRMQDTL